MYHNDQQQCYHVVQTAAYAVMAALIMRLKLFLTPQLAILASLLVVPKVRIWASLLVVPKVRINVVHYGIRQCGRRY